MMLIKNGRVIDPGSGYDGPGDLLVDGDRIIKFVKNHETQWATYFKEVGLPETPEVIDVSGMIVAPGLVDVHVHFRDPGFPHKEDIETGAAAAKAGGYTTVVCMANTRPPIDTVETLEYVLNKGRETGIHVLSTAAVSVGLKGKELTDMELLSAHGAAGFTDDGAPLMDGELVRKAMIAARRLNCPLSFHEEDPAFVKDNGVNRGCVSEALGLSGSSSLSEDSLVARDCMIALHTGAAVNIQHISSKNSVKMVGFAKSLGADVWAEVTPHHFTLDETAVLTHGTLAKMNPPLRTAEDRAALIEGLKDGTIDMIATDHAPHSEQEKNETFREAPSGIIGLETALPLAVTKLVKAGHLSYVELFQKMCLNPSKLYRLDSGTITEGSAADLVVFDDREVFTVDQFQSRSVNSPFIGEQLTGKVKYTICNGKVVYEA